MNFSGGDTVDERKYCTDWYAGSGKKYSWCCTCKKIRTLHEIIEKEGLDGFNEIENQVNASIDVKRTIIATGGSAVYGKEAMQHLHEIGAVFYLKLSYEELKNRLGDLSERGVSIRKEQTLLDLYEERKPLYEKYADYVVDCEGKSIREVVEEMTKLWKKEIKK